ncbi:hypothetical protein XELAEV_18044097mg [Xenopus laevis]|uniref:Uncharacterized protein n=1 Tax=Xenopus laevis TaxID=8355 RepID=A0A974H316_XENLA|nr:hypothetical protein XELAEV_18044097mg [Xenopus laevis]
MGLKITQPMVGCRQHHHRLKGPKEIDLMSFAAAPILRTWQEKDKSDSMAGHLNQYWNWNSVCPKTCSF